MKNEPFVIERTFNAAVEKVWKAITDKAQMKQWYFDIAEFKTEVGFEFQFTAGSEERPYVHLCKITEVIPNKKLTYSWRYEGYAGNSYVTWELFAEGDKTRVKLTHAGLETFPIENPDLAKHNFVAGWIEIVGNLLKEFVEVTEIKLSVEIGVPQEKVWKVLTNEKYIKQWAGEFSEGAYIETDFKPGSDVVWKDKEGNIGASGKVVTKEDYRLLKVAFYDDADTDARVALGNYSETYSLSDANGKTALKINAGALSLKDYKAHLPLWEKAIAKMKVLAEVG